ncbi:hypothetical protein HYX18_04715 [Candidatus Woesearchaeota archaeon]|nr:hypothetical protein [Candidatus Woesearchaeota archaeon]
MNKTYKLTINIMIFLAVITLISSYINAIGITPGRKTINFEPNYRTTVQFSIINNEKKDMGALIYVEGELNNSVTLHDSIVEFRADEESKSFSYDVKLPNEIKEPGIHEARIVVREIPLAKGTTVGATPAVISQLYVIVPYPGKYAKAKLSVVDTEGNKPVKFFIVIDNLGEQDVVNAKAIIDVYGLNNEKITTINTNSRSIKSKDKGDLYGVWDSKNINPGKYYAKATITYDDEVTETDLVFGIGQLIIDILGIEVNNFKLGGIAKFDIHIENKWSEDLKNVYAEISLEDQKGNEIVRFKSSSEEVKKNSKTKLIAFWDSAGFKEGTYNGKVIVYYNDKSTEKQLRAVVTLNSIKTEFVGITAEAVAVKSAFNNQGLLMFLVVALIIVNIAWFVYFKRKVK